MKGKRGLIDLTGKKFGRLTVLAPHPERYRYSGQTVPRWICHCDCGTEVVVPGRALRSGNTASCGCARIEKIKKHGLSETRAYQAWINMKSRCLNPNSPGYSYWGGRGIGFNERWREFEAFYAEWVTHRTVCRSTAPTMMGITVQPIGVGPTNQRSAATSALE